MKKMFAMVLAVALYVTVPVGVLAESDGGSISRGRAVEKILDALYDGGAGFAYKNYYCTHSAGYTHFTPDEDLMQKGYPILCQLYMQVDGSGFLDARLEDSDFATEATLGKAMGIVSGYGDNRFRPEQKITYTEAITMLVNAFYYDTPSKTSKYPDTYLAIGEEMGLSINDTSQVSEEAFEELLAVCLNNPSPNVQMGRGRFRLPTTPEECVTTYAQAVRDRNGRIQYALFDDQLKEQKRGDFDSWVTGVSSPWVSGFDIEAKESLEYEVTFHYETSTGPTEDRVFMSTVVQVGTGFQISKIAEKEF